MKKSNTKLTDPDPRVIAHISAPSEEEVDFLEAALDLGALSTEELLEL